MKKLLFLVFILFLFVSCSSEKTQIVWNTQKWEKIINESVIICTPDGKISENMWEWQEKYCPKTHISELENIISLNNGVWEQEMDYVYFANIPVFKFTENKNLIQDEIQKELDFFKSEEAIQMSSDFKKEFHGDFDIYSWSGTVSVLYTIDKFVWWAHGQEIIKSFVFNNEWRLYSFDNIISDTKYFKEKILEKLENDSIVFSKDELKTGIDYFIENPNFYINEDTINFVFERYMIAAWAEWVIILSFPLSTFPFDTTSFNSQNIDTSDDWKNDINLKENNSENLLNFIEQASAESNGNKIALTFDDGPSKIHTPRLLDVLKKNNVHATFYVLGKNSSYFPDIVKRAFDEWNEIWNHTWSHPQLTRLDKNGISYEMKKTDDIIFEITWKKALTFRPPYGAKNQTVLDVYNRPAILWDVDTMDWKNKNADKNITAAVAPTKNGSIILFHDIHKESVDAIDQVIQKLKEKGYIFVTVSELLAYGNQDIKSKKSCFSAFNCK